MKILIYRWKAYNYNDIIACFRRMGHQVDEISQKLMNYDMDPEFAEKMSEQIRTNGYDFVFTVNYFALISEVCQKEGIPYVSWSCDNPLISMYHESVFNDCNRIFLFDETSVREFREMGVVNVWHLPLAVDTARLDEVINNAANAAPHKLQAYRGDVTFVGSLYEKNSYDKMRDSMPEYLQGYFEATMEAQRDLYGVNIIDRMLTTDILEQLQTYFKLEKSEGSFSDLGLIFSTTTLGFKIAQLQRIAALIGLSKKHEVNLYTESDTRDLLRVNYRGHVDYWNEMPLVFNQSRINLNFTIPNIRTGIPLRCLDVMGSGGFLLTNFQAELPLYFENGKDCVWFYSQEDMLEKVDYYLKHEEERARIARNGYEKVKEQFTYEEAIETMLRSL